MVSLLILSCADCPFNGKDNVYCRTCSIPSVLISLQRKGGVIYERGRTKNKS